MSKNHGTRYAYTTGCRCVECRAANTSYIRHYRREQAKKPQRPAWRNKRPWEPWEDALASDYTKTACQIAEMLERTPSAVTNRRRTLLARQRRR